MIIMEFCTEPNILQVFYILKLALNIVFIVVPIIFMVMIFKDIFMAVVNSKPDDELKAVLSKSIKRFIAAIIVLVPYVLLTDGVNLQSLNGKGWAFLLVIGLVHTGITYCLYFSSLKELPGQKAAILSYIDPLVAVLISVVVLNEKMTVMQIVGGLLILGFTLWNEIPPKKQNKG
jgi:drug/metabolite transporter (DMT)-like permease